MNMLESLKKANSKKKVDEIVDYIGSNPARFKELVKHFLGSEYRITQRAAWPLSYCVERHPELIKPHLKSLVDNLRKPGVTDAVKRNSFRLMQFIEIPKSLRGRVHEICSHYFNNPKEAVAIRVFAMTVMYNISLHHPELKSELAMMIEDQMKFGSAGLRARGRKILKDIESNGD